MKRLNNIKRRMGDMCVILLSVFMLALTSCDEHEPLDLGIYPGFILCDDGRVLSPSAFNADIHTPVAVVFAPQTEEHQVLAVMLDEIPPVAFADTLAMDQKTSGDVTAYDGYVNTVALQTTHLDRDTLVNKEYKADPRNYYCSPLGLLAFRSHWFLQSDYVPSVAELGLLYLSLGTVNPIIEKCGGTPINTRPENAGCWYWSSTEVSENKPNQAWLFSMADGSRHKAPKTNSYRARLIVEYNPLSINK